MKDKRDAGVSEVISFVMVLAMLILAFTVWALYAVPAGGERMEEIHTDNIQMQFSEFKSGVENTWLSNNTGVTRGSVFTLSPDVAESGLEILSFPLTQASGSISVRAYEDNNNWSTEYRGATYYPVQVQYRGTNMYTDPVHLEFLGWNNSVMSFGPQGNVQYVLPGSYRYLVMVPKGTKMEVSGSGRVVVDYRLVAVQQRDGTYFCLFTMEVRK